MMLNAVKWHWVIYIESSLIRSGHRLTGSSHDFASTSCQDHDFPTSTGASNSSVSQRGIAKGPLFWVGEQPKIVPILYQYVSQCHIQMWTCRLSPQLGLQSQVARSQVSQLNSMTLLNTLCMKHLTWRHIEACLPMFALLPWPAEFKHVQILQWQITHDGSMVLVY